MDFSERSLLLTDFVLVGKYALCPQGIDHQCGAGEHVVLVNTSAAWYSTMKLHEDQAR